MLCQVNYWQILINLPIPHHPALASCITALTPSQSVSESFNGSLHLSAPSPWSQAHLYPALTHFLSIISCHLSWGKLCAASWIWASCFSMWRLFHKGISHWNTVHYMCCFFEKAFSDPLLEFSELDKLPESWDFARHCIPFTSQHRALCQDRLPLSFSPEYRSIKITCPYAFCSLCFITTPAFPGNLAYSIFKCLGWGTSMNASWVIVREIFL